MKRFVIIVLIISIIAAGGYFAWTYARMSPDNLSHVEIITPEEKATEYALDYSSAGKLLADLDGTPASSVPGQDCPVYRVILHHKLGYARKYEIIFADNLETYVRDLWTGRTVLAENPLFLHSHEGFDGLYPYREPPATQWFIESESFLPKKESLLWSYKKRDNNWYDATYGHEEGINAVDATSPGSGIILKTDIEPDTVYLSIFDKEGSLLSEQPLDNKSMPVSIPIIEKDGLYRYLVSMEWSDRSKPYKGKYTCEFDLEVDLPCTFEFSSKTAVQGEVITVRALNINEDESPLLKQNLFKQFKFYKNGAVYTGYLPTNYQTKPGDHVIQYGTENGTLSEDIITIKARDFHIQHLSIDPAIESSTRNDAAYAEYNKYFNPVRLTSADTPYFSDTFVLPATGRLTTEFGETRYVNGAPTSYRHSGLDIAAPRGTPVYAANRGRVVLAMFLTLTGNTVVIDHGQGLFSIYFHMHTLDVEQDSIVERGQQIGTVGSTGFSTGPHLHFTMSVFEQNIEPGYFIAGGPITYDTGLPAAR
ncbi:MAG: M23 family metallopeptidase [Bacillota bacterium]